MQQIRKPSAFGIIELSIILTIISIIIVVVTTTRTTEIEVENKIVATQDLSKIVDAISQFASENKRLPCPASLELVPSDSNFGKELFDTSSADTALHQCSGNGIFYDDDATSNQDLIYGMVPVNDLGLNIDSAQDSYGSKIIYIVDKRLAKDNGITNNIDSDGLINLENKISNESELLDFLVISYGPNKNNAYNFESIKKNASSQITDEISNQLIEGNGDNFDRNFVKASEDDGFDDILQGGIRVKIIKEYDMEDLLTCEEHSDFLYGVNMVWNSDGSAKSGELVASDTPCPPDFSDGPAYAYKRCTNGTWGNVENGCKGPISCLIDIDGVDSRIVGVGSGTLNCSKKGYQGSINYNCEEIEQQSGEPEIQPFTPLGSPQGECRQKANGRYPLIFNKSYSDLRPHTDGNNAELAKQRCEDKCRTKSWCLATQVTTRDVWPTPECGLVTDYNTYVNASDKATGENLDFSWGARKTIDGETYITYCNGSGTDCDTTIWGGGKIYVRDGYSCYVKPQEVVPPSYILNDNYDGGLLIDGSCSNIGDGCYIEDIIGIANSTVKYGVNNPASSGTLNCRDGFVGNVSYSCECTLGASFTEHCPRVCPCSGVYKIGDYASVHSNGISGINLNSGVKITVYDGANFTGSSATFTSSQDNCSNGWNDRMRSYKLEMANGICPEANINLSVTDSCAIETLPDFSSVIDAKIGDQSELDTIESNIKLWLDASNIDGNNNKYVKNGQKISKWYDLSGNNYNATQDNESNTAIYNDSSIIFDGSNDHFNLPNIFAGTSQATGIIVIKDKQLSTAARNNGHWDFGNYGHVINHYGGGCCRQVYDNFGMGSRPLTVSDLQKNNTTQIYMIQNNGSNFTSYMDGKFGISASSGGYNMRSNPVIGKGWGSGNTGGSHYFMGEIKEVILFDKILSDKERYVITHYLSKKWGLEDFVDSDGDTVVDSLDDSPYGLDDMSLSDAITNHIGDLAGDVTHLNSKLKLWLDALNTDGHNNASVAHKSAIAKWLDMSGNEYHLSQDNSGFRPILRKNINTRHFVDFESNDFLTTNISGGFSEIDGQDRTVMVLFKQEKAADNIYAGSGIISTRPYGNEARGLTFSIRNTQNSFAFSREQSGSDINTSYNLALNQFHILTLRTTTNSQQILKEGKLISDTNLTNWNITDNGDFVVGKERHADSRYGYQYHGKIAEILVFNERIEDEDLYKINHYLARKWYKRGLLDSDGDGALDVDDPTPISHLLMHFTFDNTNVSEVGDYKIITNDASYPDGLDYNTQRSRDGSPVIYRYAKHWSTGRAEVDRDCYKLNKDLDLTAYPKFSISFWANADSDINGQTLAGASDKYTRLFNMRRNEHGYLTTSETNIGIVLDYWSNSAPYTQNWNMKGYYRDGSGWNYLKSTPFPMDFRNWVHYAWTFDNEDDYIAFYKNGELIGSHNTSYNYSIIYPYLFIGSHVCGGSQASYFDDFRIYTKELTPLEIAEIYNGKDSLTIKDKKLIYGNGIDGDAIINSGNINTDAFIVGRSKPDAEVFAVDTIIDKVIKVKGVGTGQTQSINVGDSYKIGDLLLLINMRGDQSNYSNVGNYELVNIAAINEDNIEVDEIKNIYGASSNDDLSSQSIMVQRVPQYDNLTINGNATIQDWDGELGGIFAVKVKNRLTIGGTVNVSNKGYRGGARVDGGAASYGLQGESISGQTNIMINSNNQGGGGGGISCSHAAGGAGGGYGANGANGSNGSNCSPGGTAGLAYGESSFPSKIFLGSGGGSGGEDNRDPESWAGPGHKGGDGGGIIMIYANNMTINSGANFIANGENGESRGSTYGQDGGGGGGGSGGSINIIANNNNGNVSYQINGGAKGTVDTNGDGGAGSVGRFSSSLGIAEIEVETKNYQYNFEVDSLNSKITLWLDATNIDGYQNSSINDGDKISSWKNLVGSFPLTQSTSSLQPTYVKSFFNQKPAVKFERSAKQFLKDVNYKENLNTVFLVYKPNQDIGNDFANCGGVNFNVDDNVALWIGSVTSYLENEILSINNGMPMEAWLAPDGVKISSQNANIFSSRYSGRNMNLYYNGVTKNNGVRTDVVDQFTTNGIMLSRSTTAGTDKCHLDGHVAELIIASKDLTDDEFVKINYYLSSKWGLTATMDSDGDLINDAIDNYPLTSAGEDLVNNIGPKLWLDSKNIDGQNNQIFEQDDNTSSLPFTPLGSPQGECRQKANGRYPLIFNRSYSDLRPHTDGNNAELARQRCEDKCRTKSWCLATQVTTRDVWPTPECGLVTDYNTYFNASDKATGENLDFSWGARKTIDGETYITYCNGSGTDCDTTIWGGGKIYVRDGYSCYVKPVPVDEPISEPISSWYDLSGNNYNVTQSSTSNQPTYDALGVYFDGVNDYMWSESLESLNEATIFAVIDLGNIDFSGNNAGGGAVTIQQKGADNFDSIVYHERSDAHRKFMHGSSSSQRFYVSSVTEVDTGPFIYQYQIKSGDFKMYRNGVLVGSAGHGSSNKPNTRFIIGNRHFGGSGTGPVSNGYWYGRIYETIILNRKVTDEERYQITQYLANKWGLSSSVDSDGDGIVDNIDDNPLLASGPSCDTSQVSRINNPDFFYRYGSYTSGVSYSLNNWTLSSSIGTWSNEGLNSILTTPENFGRYGNNGENNCCNVTYPRAAGFRTNSPTITIAMDKQYYISEFEWYGVNGIHGSYRNAKDILMQGSNDNATWVDLLSFQLPEKARWDTASRFTLDNPGSYQYVRFIVSYSWGDTSSTKIGTIYLFGPDC